ncbi:PRE9 [Ecytonucleospora hepatopenaei]|uniref:PRE9 n=1 Tax=Ecytonucleospora hepatopenaei TaxID=646526 RepID=A0A1W0E541_9MICR|nr:PRE9 [Ecytonucleospora hepatopenaei]
MSEQNNTFNEEGRLLQTEYAIKKVSQAGTIMGLVCTDGVVLFGLNFSKTLHKEKIYMLTPETYCAVGGLFGDANMLIKKARISGVRAKEWLCGESKTKFIVKSISFAQNFNTRKVNGRPYGVSFLLTGYDDKYVLYSVDPSGTINNWKAWAIGMDETAINQTLRNEFKEEMSMEEGVVFLLSCFKKAKEVNLEMAEKMEILLFTKEEKKFMDVSDIKQKLKDIGVKI